MRLAPLCCGTVFYRTAFARQFGNERIRWHTHTRFIPRTRGPECTQTLADLGADVVKVERPTFGDDTRGWGPPFLKDAAGNDSTDAAYYLGTNRNKRSITCDIAYAEGQEIIRSLVLVSDVFIENFKVGDMARYGLDFASLAKINPRLVYCSVTGFGQTGPYRERAGYDYAVQGIGGLMSVTGERDDIGGGPQKVGVAVADLFTGMYASVAILAALRHAESTGQGQHIDMALLDTQVAMLANLGRTIWCLAKYLVVQAMRIKTSFPTKCLKSRPQLTAVKTI